MTLQPYNLAEKLRLTSLQTWHVQRASGGFYRDDLPFEAADRIEELERGLAGLHEDRRGTLSHDDLSLLSRIFNAHSTIHIDQYVRINDWLKARLAASTLDQLEGKESNVSSVAGARAHVAGATATDTPHSAGKED